MQLHHPQFLLSLLLFLPHTFSAIQLCPPSYCDPLRQDGVIFPFYLAGNNHSRRCGYPGFSLSCSSSGNTLISLRHAAPFTVRAIDYSQQLIWVSDPARCLPRRILHDNPSLSHTPFSGAYPIEYTFLNCTTPNLNSNSNGSSSVLEYYVSPVSCLSGGNYTVYATTGNGAVEYMEKRFKCERMKTVGASIWWRDFDLGFPPDFSDQLLQLGWEDPNCGMCESQGGSCGFKSDSGLDVACSVSSGSNGGFPNSVKYGLILGLGVPGLICMIGLTFYFSGRVRAYNQQRHRPAARESSPTIFPQPFVVMVGLDGPTIESYHKTILGQSRRLPGPSDDGTCSICLAEYEPRETLRSIPGCNHFFHAHCIDHWLRLNGTCPVCRNSPEKPSPTLTAP